MFVVARRLAPLPARVVALLAALTVIVTALALAGVTSSPGWTSLTSVGGGSGWAPSTGGAPAATPALSGDLARLAIAHPARRVEVIIQLAPGATPAHGRALVRSLGGQPGLDLHIIHGLSARLTAGAAARMARSPLIRVVSLNAPVKESTMVNFAPTKMATVFDQSVTATNMWNHSTGAGVGVAVIDTGITGNLPDFQVSQSNASSRVVASVVVDPGATTASDTYGHGTDVAGLIAGNGGYLSSSDPLWGRYAGSAPDANLISIKISDDSGNSTTLDAIYGLQFAVDHKADYNIRVVNLSFRSTSAQSYQTDPLDAAVEQAWFGGIVVVAAAGNLGTVSDAVSYAPANDPYAITVGAAEDHGTVSTSDDAQPSWSSQGITQDGVAKPDVLAPGAHIVSTLASGSAFASLCSSCIIGNNQYFQASGTSMAAPIVSGAVADLLAAHPNWTPSMVKGAIVNTAQPLPRGGSELGVMGAFEASGSQLVADQNLTPSSLIDPTSGTIDYSQAGWTAGSWSTATAPLAASWSAASWSCSSCTSSTSAAVSPTAGSWSAASWSNLGWSTYWG
jgi:serine protease AprX